MSRTSFRAFGEDPLHAHPLAAKHRAVLQHILSCRTAALGGHKDRCDTCGQVRYSYNSCRDRHCPKCQNLKKAQWLLERMDRLLPTAYFHVVFTLPAALRPLVLQNKPVLFDLLFQAATDTIKILARDKKRLGAQVGFTAILHTWTQHLTFHPHLHCVVTGGGLSIEKDRWVKGSAEYFLPVKVMGEMFRGKFLIGLKKLRGEGRIRLEGKASVLCDPKAWRQWINELFRIDWVVYAKPPFGVPVR